MRFISFNAPDAVLGEDGIPLSFATSSAAESIACRIRVLLPRTRFTVPDIVYVGASIASIHIEATLGMPRLTEQCLIDAMQIVTKFHEDYVVRYREASNGRAVRTMPTDAATAALNKAAWGFQQGGGRIVIAPGTSSETVLEAVDPATLRVAVTDEALEEHVQRALIIGSREVHGDQRHLFELDGEVEAIISLAGDVPEARVVTTRAQAQQFYKGANRLTATVLRAARGHIPEIVGEYEIGE